MKQQERQTFFVLLPSKATALLLVLVFVIIGLSVQVEMEPEFHANKQKFLKRMGTCINTSTVHSNHICVRVFCCEKTKQKTRHTCPDEVKTKGPHILPSC